MHGDSFYAAVRVFSEVQLQLGKKKKEFTAASTLNSLLSADCILRKMSYFGLQKFPMPGYCEEQAKCVVWNSISSSAYFHFQELLGNKYPWFC